MATNVSFSGPAAGSIVSPSAIKATLASNYLNFHGSGGGNWSQQYLPELYEQEVERYGNRTVSSFLRMVGAEMPIASDIIQWSEQGRLHLAVTGATRSADVITSNGHPFRVGQTVIVSDGTDQEKANHYSCNRKHIHSCFLRERKPSISYRHNWP